MSRPPHPLAGAARRTRARGLPRPQGAPRHPHRRPPPRRRRSSYPCPRSSKTARCAPTPPSKATPSPAPFVVPVPAVFQDRKVRPDTPIEGHPLAGAVRCAVAVCHFGADGDPALPSCVLLARNVSGSDEPLQAPCRPFVPRAPLTRANGHPGGSRFPVRLRTPSHPSCVPIPAWRIAATWAMALPSGPKDRAAPRSGVSQARTSVRAWRGYNLSAPARAVNGNGLAVRSEGPRGAAKRRLSGPDFSPGMARLQPVCAREGAQFRSGEWG